MPDSKPKQMLSPPNIRNINLLKKSQNGKQKPIIKVRKNL